MFTSREGAVVFVAEEVPDGHFFDIEGIRPRVEALFRTQGIEPDWDEIQVIALSPVWRKGDRYTSIRDSVIRKDGEPHLHLSAVVHLTEVGFAASGAACV